MNELRYYNLIAAKNHLDTFGYVKLESFFDQKLMLS